TTSRPWFSSPASATCSGSTARPFPPSNGRSAWLPAIRSCAISTRRWFDRWSERPTEGRRSEARHLRRRRPVLPVPEEQTADEVQVVLPDRPGVASGIDVPEVGNFRRGQVLVEGPAEAHQVV